MFYQPVWLGNDESDQLAYVDGGMLANLPLHLTRFFKDCEHLPVIAFRLKGEDLPPLRKRRIRIVDFGIRTVNAIVGGNTDLQLLQNPRVATVSINTGDVATTDFDIDKTRQSQLFTNGNKAAEEFFRSPQTLLEIPHFGASLVRTLRSSLLDRFSNDILVANTHLCGFIHDLRTVIDLLPSLLLRMADERPPKIQLLYHPTGSETETDLQQAAAIGCELRLSPKPLLLMGMLKDPYSQAATMTLIERMSGDERAVRVLHTHEGYGEMISLFANYFYQVWECSCPTGPVRARPRMTPIPAACVIEYLRHVPQYADADVQLCATEIDPNNTYSLQLVLQGWRVRRIEQLAKVCEKYEVPFCGCAYLDGSSRVSIPPVVETVGERTVVIRGHHRIFYAQRMGMTTIPVIAAGGVLVPLPASPVTWDRVRTLPMPMPDEKRHKEYKPEFKRPIGVQLDALGSFLRKSALS